jgi:hypothetical protein
MLLRGYGVYSQYVGRVLLKWNGTGVFLKKKELVEEVEIWSEDILVAIFLNAGDNGFAILNEENSLDVDTSISYKELIDAIREARKIISNPAFDGKRL